MNRTELCSQQTDFNIWEQISAFLIPRTLFFGRTSPATGPCHHLQNEVLTNLHPALSVRFSRQCETGSTTYHILAIRPIYDVRKCTTDRTVPAWEVPWVVRRGSAVVAWPRQDPSRTGQMRPPHDTEPVPTSLIRQPVFQHQPTSYTHHSLTSEYANSAALSITHRPVFSLGHSQACTHRLWPAAIQPYIALVCHSNALYHANTFTNSFTKSRWMEGWVGLIFTDHHTCTSHDINIILFIKPCGKKIDWRDIYNV